MTPSLFVERLEKSGYRVRAFDEDVPSFTIPSVIEGWFAGHCGGPGVKIYDRPGEQWDVFGWCVKELERLGWEWGVETGNEGYVFHASSRPLAKDAFHSAKEATAAAMSALAAVLEER